MANIYFTGVVESPFNYSQNIDLQKEIKGVELGVRAELIYSEESDGAIIGFHILFKKGEDQILSYSTRLSFKIDTWSELIKGKNEEYIKSVPELKQMIDIALGFTRGSMYVRSQNTPVSKLVLPILSVESILQHIVVIKKS